MSTFTKEQLIEKLQHRISVASGFPESEKAQMDLELARIALASLEAEPVSFNALRDAVAEVSGGPAMEWSDIYKGHQAVPFINFNSLARIVEKFRTATPEPVAVPEPIKRNDADGWWMYKGRRVGGGCAEWYNLALDDCRAAMLQGSEPVTTTNKLLEETDSSLQLRNLIRQRHAEWSQATFGDVGPVGPLKHLSKEALEAAEEPDDLSEWADMQFLLWDAQRRAGISDGEITAAMEEKLKVNMARQWPEPKDGEPRLHIKAAPQQEAKNV